MYKWTNKHDILRDLCEAQGDVPIDVHRTIGVEDKPPPLDIKEETEEQYFACSGEGPDGAAPDLKLIQQMLNIVRNNPAGSDSDEPETPVTVTPYNPLNIRITKPKKLLQNNQVSKTIDYIKKPIKQAPRQRKNNNVAMNSIMKQNKESSLIKPDELKTETDSKTEVEDSDNFTIKAKNKKPAVLLEPPTNMFRKKCKVASPSSSPSSSTSISPSSSKDSISCSRISSSSSKNSLKVSPNCSKVYVPSSSALEYMNKLKEKAKLKETIVEDVWSKAMKQMKEIDEKRKLEYELAAASLKNNKKGHGDETSSQEGEEEEEEEEEYIRTEPYNPMEMLKLARHRHFLGPACVVCAVFWRRGVPVYGGSTQ